MTENSAISVAIVSASYNIILQVLVRVVSSVSNAFIFRLITKDALGVINVRLLLLYSTCHCLSRESFRRSCLSKFDSYSLEKKFNLLWMIVPVCILCSGILRYVWLHLLEVPDPHLVANYASGVNTIVISVLIECLAEPLYVFSQSCQFVKLKVFTEGLMLTARSVSMVISLQKWPQHAVYCFCFSQILGSIIYTATFYIYILYYLNSFQQIKVPLLISSIYQIFPSFLHYTIDINDIYLTWSFFKQTLLKQFLTEGERYLMTFFELLTFAEQGLYDVVNNLGSLAARFIFLPIEDSAYLLFTQLLSRDKIAQIQENVSLSLNILQNILKLMLLLGFSILVFGFSYSQILLYFYGGTKLSTGLGLSLLRWHCLYVLLIAINGVTEGFKFAVMNHQQIDRLIFSFLSFHFSFFFVVFFATLFRFDYVLLMGFTAANHNHWGAAQFLIMEV